MAASNNGKKPISDDKLSKMIGMFDSSNDAEAETSFRHVRGILKAQDKRFSNVLISTSTFEQKVAEAEADAANQLAGKFSALADALEDEQKNSDRLDREVQDTKQQNQSLAQSNSALQKETTNIALGLVCWGGYCASSWFMRDHILTATSSLVAAGSLYKVSSDLGIRPAFKLGATALTALGVAWVVEGNYDMLESAAIPFMKQYSGEALLGASAVAGLYPLARDLVRRSFTNATWLRSAGAAAFMGTSVLLTGALISSPANQRVLSVLQLVPSSTLKDVLDARAKAEQNGRKALEASEQIVLLTKEEAARREADLREQLAQAVSARKDAKQKTQTVSDEAVKKEAALREQLAKAEAARKSAEQKARRPSEDVGAVTPPVVKPQKVPLASWDNEEPNAYVSATQLNVRDKPAGNNVGNLSCGAAVHITSVVDDNWVEIALPPDNRRAYVGSHYLYFKELDNEHCRDVTEANPNTLFPIIRAMQTTRICNYQSGTYVRWRPVCTQFPQGTVANLIGGSRTQYRIKGYLPNGDYVVGWVPKQPFLSQARLSPDAPRP